jgi:hypothetical protein
LLFTKGGEKVEFSKNHVILYVLVAAVILVVLAQSIFFLLKAIKRAKELGLGKKVGKTIRKAAVFTIAPAVGIFIGVITLTRALGIPLPWLRLSVIGSLTYETTAAESAIDAFGIEGLGSSIDLSASQYVTVALVMMLGIIVGLILVPLLCKKIDRGLVSFKQKDPKWGDILMSALFMGMISAFLGFIFGDVTSGLKGWIPVFVMIISAVIMLICGLLMKVFKWKWLNDYALPICMILSMLSAIPITNWIVA